MRRIDQVTRVSPRPLAAGLLAQGGWVNGDAAFAGPNPPGDAVITYYQRRRHIFGDLTMDVTDAGGKVVGVDVRHVDTAAAR